MKITKFLNLTCAPIILLPLTSCCITNKQVLTSTSSCVVNFTDITTDNLKCVLVGNTHITVKSGKVFGTIIPPTASLDGYIFDSWYIKTNDTFLKVDEDYIINDSVVLYPSFLPDPVQGPSIKYASNDPDVVFVGNTIIKTDGTKKFIDIYKPVAKKENFFFQEWRFAKEFKEYKINDPIPNDLIVDSPIELYPYFSSVPTGYINLSFDLNGGTLVSGGLTTIVSKNTLFKDINKPIIEKSGYSNDYWTFEDGTKITQETIIKSDSIIKANWKTFAPKLLGAAIGIYANEQSELYFSDSKTTHVFEYYTTFDKIWKTLPSNENINIPAGTCCYLRGTNESTYGANLKITGSINLSGNIMGLLDSGENKLTSFPKDNCFKGLFANSTGICDIQKDLLPCSILRTGCYENLFSNCSNIKEIPDSLLHTGSITLAPYCYCNMFSGCVNLKAVPIDLLKTEILFEHCYYGMFSNCSSLENIPALPSTTLAPYCYCSMFSGCDGLKKIDFNLLPATTLAEGCYQNMFYSCGSLESTPNLPATELVDYCYKSMFENCSNLYVKESSVADQFFFACPSVFPQNSVTYMFSGVCSSSSPTANNYYSLTTPGKIISIETPVPGSSYSWIASSTETTGKPIGWLEYESNNVGVNSSNAVIKVTFTGALKVYINSDAESYYDYTILSKMDSSSFPTQYSDSTVLEHTRSKQASPETINNFILVLYDSNDQSQHFFYVVYRKDSYGSSGSDKGFLIIPPKI